MKRRHLVVNEDKTAAVQLAAAINSPPDAVMVMAAMRQCSTCGTVVLRGSPCAVDGQIGGT